MIARMARLRMIGPRSRLAETLATLQDLGVVHVATPAVGDGCRPIDLTTEQLAEEDGLRATLADLVPLAARVEPAHGESPAVVTASDEWRARAADTRAALEAMDRRAQDLAEEGARLDRYRALIEGFGPLVAAGSARGTATSFLVLPGRTAARAVEDLRGALREVLGDEIEIATHRLAGGDLAVALITTRGHAEQVEGLLARASLEDLTAPSEYGGGNLSEALPQMLARAEAIGRDLAQLALERAELERRSAGWVVGLLAAVHDRLAALAATRSSAQTASAFVLEGWLPARELARVREHLARAVGTDLVTEQIEVRDWTDPVPVELRNPPIFRPFETITRSVPLPAYGSLDPTPFVAIGFPMLFGMILGDIGYGALLLLGAGVLALRSSEASRGRSIGQIGVACGLFSVVFGVLYGELLGDLGQRWLGLSPLALDREEAILPSLVFAVGIGLVHVLLGLLLGVVSAARGEPRKAVGRGLAMLLIVALVLALLAVAGVLPGEVYQPVLVAALVAFPLLVIAEGIVGPLELLGTLANILSYARIMAVGTASVMMAVVANRMIGAFGSVLVGVLFALVFHVVNFALGVFAPTIHVLRLHYVEFFGKFHHPDGTAYRPLRRWDPLHPTPPLGG